MPVFQHSSVSLPGATCWELVVQHDCCLESFLASSLDGVIPFGKCIEGIKVAGFKEFEQKATVNAAEKK